MPILLLIGGIIVSIYGGLASPTEAAAVGVVLSMIIAQFNGHFNRAILPIRCLRGTPACMIAFIIAGRRF